MVLRRERETHLGGDAIWAIETVEDPRTDREILVAACRDGTVRVCPIGAAERSPCAPGELHNDAAMCVLRTGIGRFVSSSWDGTVVTWALRTEPSEDTADGSESDLFLTPEPSGVVQNVCNDAVWRLASCPRGGEVR
jgi:WD40 repeat protein